MNVLRQKGLIGWVAGLLLGGVCVAQATGLKYWIGSSDPDWFSSTNWNPAGIPVDGDDVRVESDSASGNILLTNTTASLASFAISNRFLIFTNWNTTLRAGTVTIHRLGVLGVSGPFTNGAMSNRVSITCSNFTLEAGGLIDGDGKGYAGGNKLVQYRGYGPGGGDSGQDGRGAGAGYGGRGGLATYVYGWFRAQ